MAYVSSADSEEFSRPQKRHLVEASRRSGFQIPESSAQWQSKRKGPIRQPSAERTLAMELGIRRKLSSLETRRNGVGIRCPGDKFYAVVEASPDFYKQEGHIVGSTADNYRHRAEKPSEIDEVPMSYQEKKRLAEERVALAEVLELTQATGEGAHSWEDATGLYVWQKKGRNNTSDNEASNKEGNEE